MKILYLTDTHLKEKNPVSRIDNYLDSLMLKLIEVAEIATELSVDYIIHGGDFFDQAHQSVYLLNRVLEFFDKIPKRLLPIHVVLGNHEWRGRWEDWREKSALKTLMEMNLIILHEGYLLIPVNGMKVHSRHEQFVRKPVMWPHHLWTDYEGPGDIFLVSDYHPGQGYHVIKTRGGKRVHFVAPGAIARIGRSSEDICKVPSVAIIEISKRGEVDAYFRALQSAKPAEDVISVPEKASQKDVVRQQRLDDAVSALKSLSKEMGAFRIEDVVRTLAKNSTYSEIEVELCLKRLRR